MAATVLQLVQPNIHELKKQLDICAGVTGRLQDVILDYMLYRNIQSLSDVSTTDIYDYREYIEGRSDITDRQKKYYKNLLEQVVLSYNIVFSEKLRNSMDELTNERAIKNKAIAFLLLEGIDDATDIDYELRCKYGEYLDVTVAATKKMEYQKALDQLKLNSIKAENACNPLKTNVLKYANEKVFLLYHPSYELAETFYYLRDKEELVFDFSLEASGMMKRQIFKMLNYVLEEKENWHDRRERFLIPLKLLYQFCVDNGVVDIEQLTEKQILDFRDSFDGTVGTKTDTYMQIVDNIRKFLFLSAKSINWDANAWYLEKFNFEEGRENPAREIKRFTFGEVENEGNRALLKQYMQYQLGVSQKASIQTIRCNYYGILSYLRYLDKKGIDATAITSPEMENYIKCEEAKDIKAEAFNKTIIAVARFYGYMVLKKQVAKVPIHFDYYLKKTVPQHNDRAVDVKTQFEILSVLKEFPHHLRLMYLNLWCVGIRVNEVCVIKGDAYYWDGKDAWLKIYQNKMKSEKYVPIPKKLYELMMEYISKNEIKGDEYIFKNKRGGAYDAGTFCKQFQTRLLDAGIEDYNFKSHDLRHTVASFLYSNGASIEVVRDYLGHKESDMTKNYLDYIPDLLDAENELYFSEKGNELAKIVLKGLKKHG